MECFGRARKDLYCSVRLLDEAELKLNLQRHTRGSAVLDQVFDKLNLLEKDYFGLRFLDSQDQTHWLDPVKPISKQIKNGPPYILYFGVKFYMENPCRLKEEVTRYQFFLQLRMDMLQGRLPCSFHAAAELCAYATQSELGDHDPSQHSEGYISEFRFIPGQTEELERQITDLHQKLKGMAPSKAEQSFLERARWLEMYGVDLHPVLGDNNVEFFLGLTPTGVVVYRNKTQVARYYWPRIAKVLFKDTEFTLKVLNKEGLDDECAFKLPSRSASKHLWKCCVEQHAFFRLPQVGDEPMHQRKLSFSKSSFRHTGRTQREALEAASELDRPEQQINRAPSRKYSRRPSQTDISLRNVSASDEMFLDESLTSPNGLLTRLSPQPANRLPSNSRQSGRDSPTSGMSVRSVPWEDSQQARAGLFTPAGGLLVSASRQHRHRGRSKSPGPTHRHGDRSDSESEATYSARRRRRRSLGSEAGSDTESRHHHHHHQHRKRRSRSRGVSSGSESEYSRHDDDRRRRRRSRERMVSSEEQWSALNENRMVRGEVREGQEVVVKNLREGYPDSETSSYHHHHRNHHHHHHHHHHPNPNRQSERDLANAEFQKHIKKDLVDPEQFTEEERNSIPYTNIRIDGGAANGSHPQWQAPSQPRSRKSEDFSDGDISEHSTRHKSKASSPKSRHRASGRSEDLQAPDQPLGTPPPPYSTNGADRSREHMRPVRDPLLASRGEVSSGGAPLIHSGEVKGGLFSSYPRAGGGLFGSRPQQDPTQDLRVHAHSAGTHATNGSLHRDRHPDRPPQGTAPQPPRMPSPTLAMEGLRVNHSREGSDRSHRPVRHPDQHPPLPHQRDPSPAVATEGLPVAHSREDSGLGNEHEDGPGDSRQTQLSLPRQNGQPSTVAQTRSVPVPSGSNTGHAASNLTSPAVHNHTGSDLNPASQNGARLGGQPVNGTRPRGHDGTRLQSDTAGSCAIPAQTLHNGGPSYPSKLRLPSSAHSQGIPHGGSGVPNRGVVPNQGPIHNRGPDPDRGTGTVPKVALVAVNNNRAEAKGQGHLWSKSVKSQQGPVGRGDKQANGRTPAGDQGGTSGIELVDLPPGYKPNYNRDKRYSITTQEMMRVSVLHGDHRHLQTEL